MIERSPEVMKTVAELSKLADNIADSMATATALLFVSRDALKAIVDECVENGESEGVPVSKIIGDVDDLAGRAEWLSAYLSARGGYDGSKDMGHHGASRFADAAVRDK